MTRVAVFGSGYWGKNLIRNFHALGALGKVVKRGPGGDAQIAEWAPGVALTREAEEIWNDPALPAVVLATPAETHYALAKRALEAGKDVLVEKPLTLNVGEARELVALAAARGRVLMVGQQLEYHPAVEALHALLASGELGAVRYVISERLNWGRFRSEENALWSLAPHDMGLILRLMGREPREVIAAGGAWLQPKIADNAVVLMHFEGGARAHVHVSWLHPLKQRALTVVGEKQSVVFDDGAGTLQRFDHAVERKNGAPVAVTGRAHDVPFAKDEPLRRECAHFLDCVKTRATPRTDGVLALNVLRVLDAAQRSLEGRSAPQTLA